jgi:hypothetical protein
MRGDNITITFHPDGRTVQHATLTGAASLQLSGERGRRSIRGTWIDLVTAADGRTVTRLEAKDNVVVELPASGETPAREIRAATLLAAGTAARGLETARFQTGVRFVERRAAGAAAAAPERTVTSAALVLTLGGDLDSIERAEFQRDAVFLDGGTRGEADLLVYDAASERVHLSPGTRKPPRESRVRDEDVTVNATTIDLDMKTHDLAARGSVTTVSARKGAPRAGAIFDGDDPIIGTGSELDYRRDSRTAKYTSPTGARATVRQGKNVIEAPAITFSDETGNLDAAGGVVTTFLMSARDEPSPIEYRTTARTFQYDDAKRVAVYRSEPGQAPTEMTGSDRSTTVGGTITMHLAAESRTLETLVVERDVWAKLPDGTEVSGERLHVDDLTGIYVLTGRAARPARAKSAPDGRSETCTLTVGETIEFNRRTKAVTQPAGGQAYGSTQQIPCTQSIR